MPVNREAGQQNAPESPGSRIPRGDAQPRLLSSAFVLTVVITFGAFVAGLGLNTGMSVYVDQAGYTATFAGVLSVVFSGAAAVARLVVGPALDAHGRRAIMIAGSALLAAGTLLPGLFPSAPMLVTGRVVQGFGFASVTTAAATAAADTLPAARMGEGIGYYGLGQALATSVGPAFALMLIASDPAENLFFVMGAIAIAVSVLCIPCRYEKHPEMLPEHAVYRVEAKARQAERPRATDGAAYRAPGKATEHPKSSRIAQAFDIFEPGALAGSIPVLVLSAAFGFCMVFVGLYGERLSIGNGGLFYTCSAVTTVLIRLKSKSFMDRVLPIKVFGVAAACGVVCFALLLASPVAPPLFYAAGVFYGACLGIGFSINQSVVVKNTPPERLGAGNALFLLANDIGLGVASLIWGVVNDSLGFSASIIGAACCVAASYALAWMLYPAYAKHR